jgi:hypothetical protein
MKATKVSDASTRMIKGRKGLCKWKDCCCIGVMIGNCKVSPQTGIPFVRRLKASLMTLNVNQLNAQVQFLKTSGKARAGLKGSSREVGFILWLDMRKLPVQMLQRL